MVHEDLEFLISQYIDGTISPDDRVALVLPNRPESVAAYHGVLRLGATVVPLNPLLTEREVELRVADSGAARFGVRGSEGARGIAGVRCAHLPRRRPRQPTRGNVRATQTNRPAGERPPPNPPPEGGGV